jgi:hypothetical protein
MKTDGTATWETYLRSQFPAYLLPKSAVEKLSVEEASRFLTALADKPSAFTMLHNVSFLAPRMADLRSFVERVRVFVRSLPSTTEMTQRYWNGGFQGKLDLRTTTLLHAQGRRTEFVTRTPRRDFDVPENIVLRSVCERLHALLKSVRQMTAELPDDESDTDPRQGWGSGGRECEGVLNHTLSATALRNVSSRRAEEHDLGAARASRQLVFQEAARWHDDLHLGLDTADPIRIARTVAEGSLLPLSKDTQFEIAVAIKLIAGVSEALEIAQPGKWQHERGLVIAGRRDIATLHHADLAIRFFYNQAELDAGATDRGVQHYLAPKSRMRPDVTVTICRGDHLLSALVVECKHTQSKDYLISGFKEAMLYRYEYAPVLRGAVKSVLVGSSAIPSALHADHDVIAVAWNNWPPEEVVSSVISALDLDAPPATPEKCDVIPAD